MTTKQGGLRGSIRNVGVGVRAITDSEVYLFAVGGQSNATGRGDSANSPDPNTDEAYEYVNDTDTIENPLDDPINGNEDVSDTGSAWPRYVIDYFTARSEPPAIVGASKGGAAQNSLADAGGGSYDTDGTLQGDLVTFYQNAEAAFATVVRRGVLWNQGERDAQEIDNGGMTKADYKSAFETMISDTRSDLSEPDLPYWVFQTGHLDSGDTAGFQDVREAQAEVVVSDPNVHMASAIQKDFPEEGKMTDDVHYNQTGLNEMGAEGAANITDHLVETTQEDWEAGTSALDNWTLYDGTGSVVSDNGWVVNTNSELEGAASLNTGTSGSTTHVVSEGLFTTDETQTIRSFVKTDVQGQIDFFWQDYDNYYMLNFNVGSNEIAVFLKEAGSFSSTVLDTGVLSADTPYRAEIIPQGSGTFDINIVNMTEWTVVGEYTHTFSTVYTSGNVGFRQATGDTYHDYLRTL